MDFKPSGEFINPHFDDLLFETIGDDFLRNGEIVIAIVQGENFEQFCDINDRKEASKLVSEFIYEEFGSCIYGKWDELSELVGEKEQKELRSSYFDCQDFENVNSVVLLYYQNKFVTLVTADEGDIY